MLNKIKSMVQGQFYKSKAPLDYSTWVFSSVDNCNFNYNSKYMFLHVRKKLPQITPLFVINDPAKRNQLAREYGEQYFVDSQSKAGMKRVLLAGVWITSAGLPVYEWKGDTRRIVVNLWHGIPLKKIALMEEHAGRFYKMYFKRIFSDKYTCILTTSEHLVGIMARSFQVSQEKIKVWGQPRNDAVLQGRPTNDLWSFLGIENCQGEKAILYAPTYRDQTATKLFPFGDYQKEELEEFLAEHKYHIFIRLHLKEQMDGKAWEGSRIHVVNEDVIDDIASWMSAFDLLITDYSSIYLDFLLLDKPMIFLPYDREEYLRDRGMNFSYDKVTPGEKPSSQKSFLCALKQALEGQDEYAKERRKCNEYFNEMKEPCSEKICQEILGLIGDKES